jgi:hypothetical protein
VVPQQLDFMYPKGYNLSMFSIIETEAFAHWLGGLRDVLIVMLGGGDKSSQQRDIAAALSIAKEIDL